MGPQCNKSGSTMTQKALHGVNKKPLLSITVWAEFML
jgi:hypothetical protein